MPSVSSRPSGEGRGGDLLGGLRVLAPFNPFKSRKDFPCPLRLTLNVYVGCSFGCKYCYGQSYIRAFGRPRAKRDFERNLERDIATLKERGIRPWVSISNSTDPLQSLERRYRHTLYALRRLLDEGFPVLVVTKNPRMLLEPEYLEAIGRGFTKIHVTIPFLQPSPLEPHGPPPEDRIEAIRELISLGFDVGVRVDPVIPRVGEIGQSEEELRLLLWRLAEAGVRRIYAKVLRLMGRLKALQGPFYASLKPYFQRAGIWKGSYFVLSEEERARVLSPLVEFAHDLGMEVFTCTDRVGLPGVRRCEFEDDAKLTGL